MSALRKDAIVVFFPSQPRLAVAAGAPPSDPPPPTGPQIFTYPGFIISKVFLKENTPEWLAESLGEPQWKINALLTGRIRMTVDLANGLSEVFDMSPMFFMNLQAGHDRRGLDSKAGIQPLPLNL